MISVKLATNRQAFWLMDHPTGCAFPSVNPLFCNRPADSGILAAFVPDYSNGWPAVDSHHAFLLPAQGLTPNVAPVWFS